MDGLTSGEIKHRLVMGIPPSRLKPMVVWVRYALKGMAMAGFAPASRGPNA